MSAPQVLLARLAGMKHASKEEKEALKAQITVRARFARAERADCAR